MCKVSEDEKDELGFANPIKEMNRFRAAQRAEVPLGNCSLQERPAKTEDPKSRRLRIL